MTAIVLYGISNCDTVKKARRWLADQALDYRFHDFRKDGLDAALLDEFMEQLGWETLVNRRGTTWRKLDQDTRDSIDAASAKTLMLDNPALIKRPVLVRGGRYLCGFSDQSYGELLS